MRKLEFREGALQEVEVEKRPGGFPTSGAQEVSVQGDHLVDQLPVTPQHQTGPLAAEPARARARQPAPTQHPLSSFHTGNMYSILQVNNRWYRK